jgi:hypothetical protein
LSAHPDWRQEKHEARRPLEAKEAEARAWRTTPAWRQAEQQLTANNSKALFDWVDQRVVEHLKRDRNDLYDILGKVVAKERAAARKEIKAAVADDAKLAERRNLQHIENHTEQCNQGIIVSAGRAETLGKAIEAERTDRHKELAALEQRLKSVPGRQDVAPGERDLPKRVCLL